MSDATDSFSFPQLPQCLKRANHIRQDELIKHLACLKTKDDKQSNVKLRTKRYMNGFPLATTDEVSGFVVQSAVLISFHLSSPMNASDIGVAFDIGKMLGTIINIAAPWMRVDGA